MCYLLEPEITKEAVGAAPTSLWERGEPATVNTGAVVSARGIYQILQWTCCAYEISDYLRYVLRQQQETAHIVGCHQIWRIHITTLSP